MKRMRLDMMVCVTLAVSALALRAEPKREAWLMLAPAANEDAPLVAASLAWMAEEAGALVDTYFESPRDGGMFTATGSLVLGGHHFNDFNYLCNVADVKIIRLGKTGLFSSSIRNFGLETIAEGETASAVYGQLLARHPALKAKVTGYYRAQTSARIRPYLYPEVAYAKRLYLPAGENPPAGLAADLPTARFAAAKEDDPESVSKRIAAAWKSSAKSVFYGRDAHLRWRIPAEVRRRSVPLCSGADWLGWKNTDFSTYTEFKGRGVDAAADLARELGDRVLWGVQGNDADLFAWAKKGVAMQIIDPYRPTFPMLAEFVQPWTPEKEMPPIEADPSDEQLRKWAHEDKILVTLVWHSGEIAHNDPMLNVVELAQMKKFRMGVAVHAQRYETLPQLWELIGTPAACGGAAEYVEPVLHCGGLGVAPEACFPPDEYAASLREAKRRIGRITGPRGVPTGVYAFMDSDLQTCLSTNPAIWKAAGAAGMDYFISCSCPGRSRVLHDDGITVINQSFPILERFSPFLRITGSLDVRLGRQNGAAPGWIIGVFDTPVVAAQGAHWEEYGMEVGKIIDTLQKNPWYVNAKPRVIARYAKILKDEGLLPRSAIGGKVVPATANGNGK